MPEISRYLGIRVFIRYRDHPPPHFHARYGEDSAIIAIETMQILEARKLAARNGPRTVALDSAAGSMRC